MKLSDLVTLTSFYEIFFSDPLYAEFYRGSGYANFGYWPPGITNAAAAGDALVDLIIEPVTVKEGTVLDVACGHGATTNRLCAFFEPRNITGVGLDATQLMHAKRRAPDCQFRRMNATRLGFADESFDVVVCVEAAFHFDRRQDFFAEAYRVLKPGGQLVLSDLLMSNHVPLTPKENFVPSVNDYALCIEDAGFRDVAIDEVTDLTWYAFRREFNEFATAKSRRIFTLAAVRDLLTVNVNTSWATQAYVTACATKPG